MTEEERFKITDSNYMDLMISLRQSKDILKRFPNASTHYMNDENVIVYVPKAQITNQIIRQYGYSILPACYGLVTEKSLESSGVIRVRRLPNLNLRGSGVLIGIIDTGIDYTNKAFRNPDGSSKIAAIWDQTISSEKYPQLTSYGTEYLKEDIDKALNSPNPLEIVPSVDTNGHGTMLAGIAGGSENAEYDFSGVAPDVEFIIVKLKQAKKLLRDFFLIPENVDCYQENDIMWAVQYCVGIAKSRLQRTISICIGLSSSQGSHDGMGALSNVINVVTDFSGVAVTVAAGNEGDAARHFYDVIDQKVGYSTVELNVAENDPGFSMELWGTTPATYSIDILSPTGEYIPRITESLRVNREINFIFELTSISLDYNIVETSTGDQVILMRFRKPTAGIWTIKVYSRGDVQGSIHIWLPIGAFISKNTYFLRPNSYTTISSPGNAPTPITVTAYNQDNGVRYQSAGKGYTRINVVKPEFAAPGVNIQAPDLMQGFSYLTGTSAAAAHTAGVVALCFEWGVVRGNYPDVDVVEIKNFLIRGARRTPSLTYPNQEWGYGILDLYNSFLALIT